jgi:Ca2+-binding EF-hand superfamily protein
LLLLLSGKVDRNELKVFLKACDKTLDNYQLEAAITYIDQNDDGEISLKEFAKFIFYQSLEK